MQSLVSDWIKGIQIFGEKNHGGYAPSYRPRSDYAGFISDAGIEEILAISFELFKHHR
jgi:hypothetical protein